MFLALLRAVRPCVQFVADLGAFAHRQHMEPCNTVFIANPSVGACFAVQKGIDTAHGILCRGLRLSVDGMRVPFKINFWHGFSLLRGTSIRPS